MKEIHAYRNEDGTYRVQCIADVATEVKEFKGKPMAEEIREAIIETPRAQIYINTLSPSAGNSVLATLTLGGEQQ
jgi:hypothetical protein